MKVLIILDFPVIICNLFQRHKSYIDEIYPSSINKSKQYIHKSII